ncbi:MAG: amino acid dehydrogenase [Ectothiorhodospiraceae bacterium]|nr:amino acid dehydrogenase [Ectothiorhodospiraceae bacterium]
MELFRHPDFDYHEQVVFACDVESGLEAIIAVHNTDRGPACGGCRMVPYPDTAAAVTDVLRLSRGMTYKSAMAELPLGGGKMVVLGDPRRHKTPALLRALGRFVDSLHGRYVTAEDAGMTLDDLRGIAETTRHVVGIQEKIGADGEQRVGDPSPSTEYGVYVGLQAAVAHRLGRTDLAGLKVAIQGLGSVGWKLAQRLRAAGARLWVTDIHADVLKRAEAELGAAVVPPDAIFSLPVDVFAPCALGGAINDRTVESLRASVVAGAANNQLLSPIHGDRLRQRGILYAPDYVINAGGIIDVAYALQDCFDAARVKVHVESIGVTLAEIFRRADREQLQTQLVADRMAEERFRPHRPATGAASTATG